MRSGYAMKISDTTDLGTLKREFSKIYNVLAYSMHELPAGVLWHPNAATPSQCAKLMDDVSRMEVISKLLDLAIEDFVEACRWHLGHYPHYRSRERHFVNYAQYCTDRGGPLRVPSLNGIV